MHADEITVRGEVVRRLLDEQFPCWASLPLRRLPPTGTDNQLFRLGEKLLVRMPRIHWAAESAAWEHRWLAALSAYLPLAVPAPVAMGEPGQDYPWRWTVVPWIEGEHPTAQTIDPEQWAVSLAAFVRVCRDIPGLDGPAKSKGRGGPLATQDEWVRTWAERADSAVLDRDAVLAVWTQALEAPAWKGEPAWFHGDLHEGNLLVRDSRLAAVIDWGAAGRGDPAVELNAMWGYLPETVSRLYCDEAGLDEAAYLRGRGFALAPAISGFTYYRHSNPRMSQQALVTVQRLINTLA